MNIKIVNGFVIRNTIDVDFSGIGGRQLYAYIPTEELWIDQVISDETEFLTKLHELELKCLLQGMNYAQTRKKVCEQLITKTNQTPQQIYHQQAVIYSFPIETGRVDVVDGKIIRKYLDPKFIQGGNDFVYSYIPSGRICVEKSFDKEFQYIALHEWRERTLMMTGMSYDDAHDYACAAEKAERRRQGIAKYLKG